MPTKRPAAGPREPHSAHARESGHPVLPCFGLGPRLRGEERVRVQAVSSCSHLAIRPPMMPPTIGATQNSQSEPQASAPPKITVAVERAGLTEALETGIATRWMTVRNRPIAIGANPAGQFFVVTHMMTIRNRAVITSSIKPTERSEECVPP